MAFRVRFSGPILRSLGSISDYISADSPQNADEVLAAILDLIESLEIMPGRFRRVGKSSQNGSPIHMATTHSFNIYYRIDSADETVTIVLLQRGARRKPRHFD